MKINTRKVIIALFVAVGIINAAIPLVEAIGKAKPKKRYKRKYINTYHRRKK